LLLTDDATPVDGVVHPIPDLTTTPA